MRLFTALLLAASACGSDECFGTRLWEDRICVTAGAEDLESAYAAALPAYAVLSAQHGAEECLNRLEGINLWIGPMDTDTCPMAWQRGHRACYAGFDAWVDQDSDPCWVRRAIVHELLHIVSDVCLGGSTCSAEATEGEPPFCRTAQCDSFETDRPEYQIYAELSCQINQ